MPSFRTEVCFTKLRTVSRETFRRAGSEMSSQLRLIISSAVSGASSSRLGNDNR